MTNNFKEFIPNTDYQILTINGYKDFEGILVSNNTDSLLNIQFDDGSELKCTKDHKIFYTLTKYKFAKHFAIGESCFTGLKQTKKIINICEIKNEITFDLLEVSDGHHYIVNDTHSHQCLHIDEHAHIHPNIADEFFTSVYPTLAQAENPKCIIVSTPAGLNHFYKFWKDAVNGKNGFYPIEVHWSEHPDRDQKWKEKTLTEVGPEKFAQEFECDFLGSSNTLINAVHIKNMAEDTPIKQSTQLRIYQEPKENHQYLIVADPSRGTGNDDTAFIIFDISQYPIKISGVFQDPNTSSMVLPSILVKIAKNYNDASILVESNDIGMQVTDILWNDLEYENTILTGGKNLGIRTTKTVKQNGCLNFKDIVENQKIIINDLPLISQISTFVQKKKSYEADVGCKDDLVMCCVLLAFFAATDDFKHLSDGDIRAEMRNQKAAMIENDIVPFGFIVGDNELGFSENPNKFIDRHGLVWMLDDDYNGF